MTNENAELLAWAVENIKVWGDTTNSGVEDNQWTHLRSDNSQFSPSVFYSNLTGCWSSLGDEGCKDLWTDDVSAEWSAILKNKSFYEDFSTTTPQVITKAEWEATKLAQVLVAAWEAAGDTAETPVKTSQEAPQGHVHTALMAEYAEVAKTNPEPWREFEQYVEELGSWIPLVEHSHWFSTRIKYRRKPTPPKTMNIGGHVVEAWPLDHLPTTTVYWSLIMLSGKFWVVSCNVNYLPGDHSARLLGGKAFATEQQAQAVADALNKVYDEAIKGRKAEG